MPANFSDALFNSREPASTWKMVIIHGGAEMGFSEMMPAFGATLAEQVIDNAWKNTLEYEFRIGKRGQGIFEVTYEVEGSESEFGHFERGSGPNRAIVSLTFRPSCTVTAAVVQSPPYSGTLSAAKCLKKCRKLPKVMEWSENLKVFE